MENTPVPVARRSDIAITGSFVGRIRHYIFTNIIDPALRPILPERIRLNRARWSSLPLHLRVSQQAAGVVVNSCGGTHGVMDACNLRCTACYLAKDATIARPLPAEAVLAQLDELRTMLGPQGKCQITAGEVTLLPEATLIRYIRHAIRIDLDPMLMTNGQKMLEDQDYLHRLVVGADLQKLAVHVDSTQRGRRDWEHATSEAELMPLRDRFAAVMRDTRKRTGRSLNAAHTVTVSRENFSEVPEIIDWMLANADAFRMISFQPVAAVGRTTEQACNDLTMDDMWRQICAGIGRTLNRHAMYYGHPECTILACLVVVKSGKRRVVLEVAEEARSWDIAYLGRLLRAFGGLTTTRSTWMRRIIAVTSNCLRHPLLVLESPVYMAWRTWRARRELLPIIGGMLTGNGLKIQPLAIVVHRFMDKEQMATPLGQERLSCCVFNVSLDGESTPMCEMNAGQKRAGWYRRTSTFR